jgi:hypothetical protein
VPNVCSRRQLGLVALSVFVLRTPALFLSRFYDPDEASIAVQARTVAHGGRLYVDMADRKPPIPPLVYAAWFHLTSSHDIRGPRVFVTILLAVAAVMLTKEVCRTHGPKVAVWAAALYIGGVYAFSPVDALSANFAHFALPLATIALLCCRRDRWWPLLGGLMLGLAILSRQSWVFAVPAGALSVWMTTRVRGLAMYVVGTCGGVALAALMAPWSDYWFWNFKSSPGFVFASIGLGLAIARGIGTLATFIVRHLPMSVGAASTLPGSLRTQPDLWLWTVTGLMATAAGFRFYGHYWLQIVPPLTLLAAPAIAAWSPRWRTVSAYLLGLTAVVSFVSNFFPDFYRPRHKADSLAAAIKGCTSDSDRVLLWGSFPDLLVLADRAAAGGLVHSDFVTGRSGGRQSGTDAATPGAQEKMMNDLRRRPPVLLIDTSAVDDLSYQAFPMLGNTELAAFARAGYTPQQSVDGFVLWWRNGHPSCTATADGAFH